MESKDTVMTSEQILEIMHARMSFYSDGDVLQHDMDIAKVQAEISFKTGIKEVVGWLEKEYSFTFEYSCSSPKWQAKLKEWGVE